MRLSLVEINNFRSLKQVKFTPKPGINLLMGPNASGKTSVLEAIRLAKGLLAPRSPQESNQVLATLGVSSVQWGQAWNFGAIASDVRRPVKINLDFTLSDTEIDLIAALTETLSRNMLSAKMGFGILENGSRLTQYLSTDNGREAMAESNRSAINLIAELAKRRVLRLHLTINPEQYNTSGAYGFDQAAFMTLESFLPYTKTLFSYFPADRALPAGEQIIQLGIHDALNKSESHNSQPSLKYQRLKTDIFAAKVASDESAADLSKLFKKLFEGLLRGRELGDIGINISGQPSIKIKDLESGSIFDIDALSSGEKGIILTFLLIARSIENGGVVLLDEPELHLNPAVCKRLPDFLQEEILGPSEIQTIMCSHSPEILASVLKREDTAVFHIKPSNAIDEIMKRDQSEVAQVLARLGASAIDELVFEGVVYVEGDEDVEMLENGFQDLFPRFKFTQLGGRAEIERNIIELQESERKGKKEGVSYFVFDEDRRPTNLTSSALVRIEQWDRYSLENYLIDGDTLYDVFKAQGWFNTEPEGRSEAKRWFAELAKRQLMPIVMAEVYQSFGFENSGVRSKELQGVSWTEGGNNLFDRLEKIQSQVATLSRKTWTESFVEKTETIYADRVSTWEDGWNKLCNGKQFFRELQKNTKMGALDRAKRTLMRESRLRQTEAFKLLHGKLAELLQRSSQKQ